MVIRVFFLVNRARIGPVLLFVAISLGTRLKFLCLYFLEWIETWHYWSLDIFIGRRFYKTGRHLHRCLTSQLHQLTLLLYYRYCIRSVIVQAQFEIPSSRQKKCNLSLVFFINETIISIWNSVIVKRQFYSSSLIEHIDLKLKCSSDNFQMGENFHKIQCL